MAPLAWPLFGSQIWLGLASLNFCPQYHFHIFFTYMILFIFFFIDVLTDYTHETSHQMIFSVLQ